MALNTKVHIQYRTPYIPGKKLPIDVENLMRKEISAMRKDLLEKQERLRKHPKYSHSERLVNEVSNIKVGELNSTAQVWNTWNRLRSLELSHQTSVQGKNLTRSRAIESMNQAGYTGINEKNYDEFAKTMAEIKDEFQALLWDSEQIVNIFLQSYNDSDPTFRNMSPKERYAVMVRAILDELGDKWRDYNTDEKMVQGMRETTKELNKTNIAKKLRHNAPEWENVGVEYNKQRRVYQVKNDPFKDTSRKGKKRRGRKKK